MDRVHICQRQRFLLWQGCNRSDCEPFFVAGFKSGCCRRRILGTHQVQCRLFKAWSKNHSVILQKRICSITFPFPCRCFSSVSNLFLLCHVSFSLKFNTPLLAKFVNLAFDWLRQKWLRVIGCRCAAGVQVSSVTVQRAWQEVT